MSFIDVMACGLGAVILIFILIDFYAARIDPSDEINRLEAELAELAAAEVEIEEAVDDVISALADARAMQEESEQAQQESRARQQALLQQVSQQLAVIAELQDELAALAAVETPDAAVRLEGTGEENYITGMVVEGREIGILFDRSASMMDDNLIDILRALAYPPEQRKLTAKWRRTVRVGQWLLARIPESSNVTVVSFSNTAEVLGPNTINAARDGNALDAISKAFEEVVPDGGTNLLLGMQTLLAANPNITDVYLITDGLPTLGEGLSLRCRNFISRNRSISSDCRRELTVQTIRRVPGRYRMNVILLPLKGDPYAASMYWEWTNASKGILLAPADEWP
ncbi:vWA domain-containing protein [Aliidiomarina halalkaliphila]|nr:VWA domain-containing protein [Aliidiomarina halalkaliphila]